MPEEDEILGNEAALNSLKRNQLLSLSRKYGLKRSGKNVELVARLQEYTRSLNASHITLDTTNHHGDMTDQDQSTGMETYDEQTETDGESYQYTSSPDRSVRSQQESTPRQTAKPAHPLFLPPPQPSPRTLAAIPDHLLDQIATSPGSKRARPASISSEATANNWEILDQDAASIASPAIDKGEYASWKSAGNGQSLGRKSRISKAAEEFGTQPITRSEGAGSASSRTKASLKALASSLRRSTSKVLLSNTPEQQAEPVVESPPSPVPTVGIPKRHPHASLGAKSTIRMVSSTSLPLSPGTPGSADRMNGSPDWKTLTPMQGMARYQPPISPSGSQALTLYASTIATGHNRSGSFAGTILGSQASGFFGRGSIQSPSELVMGSASLAQVYPPLPILPSQYAKVSSPPGAFVFGSPLARNGISNEQFSSAGLKVLEEMNARLGERSGTMGKELLKGKDVDLKDVVKVNQGLQGLNGFGLAHAKNDRFAEAHAREFAKMASISTHAAARRGMSQPPRPTTSAYSSFASRSTATLPLNASTPSRPKRKLATAATTPSAPNGLPLIPAEDASHGRYKRSRLSIGSSRALGSIREAGASVARLIGPTERKPDQDTAELMRKLREKREKRRSMAGLAAKARRLSGRLGLTRNKPEVPPLPLPERKKFDFQASLRKGSTSVRELGAAIRRNSGSSSDLLTTSTRTSRVSTAPSAMSTSTPLKPRPKLPAFDGAMAPPPVPNIPARHVSGSAPPAKPAGPRQHSLYAPTASSLARMQATVKPRVNSETSSILSPAIKATGALRAKNPPSGTPIQSARAAARARSSGLTAVKSRPDLKSELEVQARRNEMKARRERIAEQRRLEEMLGQGRAL